jgi:hypothetical protein
MVAKIFQLLICFLSVYSLMGQSITSPSQAAMLFYNSLDQEQKKNACRAFSDSQRVNWDFVPREDRKGIRIGHLAQNQLSHFYNLVEATAGELTLDRIKSIRLHEAILRGIENRPIDDKYRDTTKYFIQLFGIEDSDATWGWKIEGHHICLNYVIQDDKVQSATPSILCSNPAVVLKGPQEGLVLLKSERDLAKSLLTSLNQSQRPKAILSSETPKEIFNYLKRKAVLDEFGGIGFADLSSDQQKMLQELVNYYIRRASKLFVKDIQARIDAAGWDKVSFAWLGSENINPGNTHYYRIQGPEFIIEYDNYQNNGNHVHSIFRDVKNDFGDALADHYKSSHDR